MLRTWLGHEPDDRDRAKLALMGALVQLFAGCILLTVVVDPNVDTHADLTAMSIADFQAGIARGELQMGTPSTIHAFAKIMLAAFADGTSTPAFSGALGVAAGGG